MARSKDKPSAIRHVDIVNQFSANFEKNVAPYISSKSTVQLIRNVWNNDFVQGLKAEELRSVVLQLTTLANRQISSYKKSDYYKMTREYLGDNVSDTMIKPTPAAYRGLIEREGELKKFSRKDVGELTLGQLRKRISNLRQFVSSESAYLGDARHGIRRIIRERYNAFTSSLKEMLGSSYYNKYKASLVKSEAFSILFWQVYNRLSDYSKNKVYKYDRDIFMGKITQEIYGRVNEFNNAGEHEQNWIIDEIVEKVRSALEKGYVESIIKDRKDNDDLRSDFEKGYTSSRRGGN